MEEVIYNIVVSIENVKSMFIIMTICVSADILTGLIKAFYLKKYNSSINRKGIASKLMWYVLMLLGLCFYVLLGTDILIKLVTINCVIVEFLSILENAKECGIDLKINEYLSK